MFDKEIKAFLQNETADAKNTRTSITVDLE